jgi:hypothetical protein
MKYKILNSKATTIMTATDHPGGIDNADLIGIIRLAN